MNINKKDVFWGYISLILVQGVNIILLPFVLIFLDSNEIGLWYTFTSIYGLAMLIDFGFQTTLSRNINYIWSGAEAIKVTGFNYSSNDKQKINVNYFIQLLSSVKFIYYLMGVIVFIILMTLGTYYIYIVTRSEMDIFVALLSWIFYLFAVVLNIMFSFWNAILKGIGAIKEYNKTLIIAKLSQVTFTVLLLTLGCGILGITIAYLISVVVNRITLSRYFYRFSSLTFHLKGKIKPKFNKLIIVGLLPNTIKTGVTSISNYLIINFPILLSSYFISLEISGQFGITSQIITLCLTLSNSYFNTYLPKFNYYRVKNEPNKLKSLFKKSILINYSINLVLFTCVIILGQMILDFMGTHKSLLPLSLLILTILYRFLYNNQLLFVSLLSTKNVIPYYKTFIISAVLTVVIQVIFLFNYVNLYALIIPALVIQFLYNNWYWPLLVIRDLKK